jgi:hypothetical protein
MVEVIIHKSLDWLLFHAFKESLAEVLPLGFAVDRLTENILYIEGVRHLVYLGGNLRDMNVEPEVCQRPGNPVEKADLVMGKNVNNRVLPGDIAVKLHPVWIAG